MKPINLFVNRVAETAYLERIYAKGRKQLTVLYGRRRVGKTELITHFCRGKKSIYFLADKRGTPSNARRFASTCAEYFNDTLPEAKNFDEVFLYIKNRVKKDKTIITIDEFSYLVEKDESIPSVFQLIFDEILQETNIFLILSGSSISMMHKGALSYESPLYGRRTGEWKLKMMKFQDVRKFYPDLTIEESIKAYGVVGGIPAYAAHLHGKDIFDGIKSAILTKGEYLYNEPEVMLKEELRDPSTYFSILEAMTSSAKLSDIANAAQMHAKDMPKYLKVLEELELIYKITPITEKKSKKTLYFVKDNFFKFWFKFVYPKKSELESGQTEQTLGTIKKEFNAYTGKIFEQVCKEYVEKEKPVQFEKIGKWWGAYRNENKERKTVEIDIASIDEKTKAILLAECKWQEKVNAMEITKELAQKASHIEWQNGNRTETFIIFAKSFTKKIEEFEGKKVHCIDLKDIEKALEK